MFDSNEVSSNAAAFSQSLMRLMDRVDGSIDAVIRKSCIDLYRRIALKTPVDTGRAKLNWQISTVDSGAVKGEEGRRYSDSEIQAFIDAEVGEFDLTIRDDQVWIYNNVEYIPDLEGGYSNQAPEGMVAVSLAEFTAHFNRYLAEEGLS